MCEWLKGLCASKCYKNAIKNATFVELYMCIGEE